MPSTTLPFNISNDEASPGLAPNERRPDQAVRVLQQVMATIPDKQKMEYTEAMQRCPHLVATESDPMQFLRFCDFNVWAAIERLCNYWRERKELFQERAFLPLTIDGNGALDNEDTLLVQAGYPTFLPKARDGRQVVFLDRSRWLPSSNTMNYNRVVFYACTLLAKDERAQQPVEEGGGVLLLGILISPRTASIYDFEYMKRSHRNVADAFPIHVESHQFCELPRMKGSEGQRKRSFIADVCSFIYRISGGNFRSNVHFEINHGDILNVMLRLGCRKEEIPVSCGGSYSHRQTQQWCRQQALQERERTSSCEYEKGQVQVSNNAMNPTDEQHATSKKRKSCTLGGKKKKWTADHVRSVNAIHSRKKRERRKQELDSLKDECEQLKKSNEALKAEHVQLRGLVAKAQELAAGESCTAGEQWNVPAATLYTDPLSSLGASDQKMPRQGQQQHISLSLEKQQQQPLPQAHHLERHRPNCGNERDSPALNEQEMQENFFNAATQWAGTSSVHPRSDVHAFCQVQNEPQATLLATAQPDAAGEALCVDSNVDDAEASLFGYSNGSVAAPSSNPAPQNDETSFAQVCDQVRLFNSAQQTQLMELLKNQHFSTTGME